MAEVGGSRPAAPRPGDSPLSSDSCPSASACGGGPSGGPSGGACGGSGPDACGGDCAVSDAGSSHCTADCVSAIGSPVRPSTPVAPSSCAEDERPVRPSVPPSQITTAERYLLAQNRHLKSTLIKTLERLQTQMEYSSKARHLLSRLLKLRGSVIQTPQPGTSQGPQAPSDLYARYEALVKQNYHLEKALLGSGGGGTGSTAKAAAQGELEEYRALVNMQMSALQQDWRDERDEKERALALNAELHQQVEQLQHQLEQLQARRPLSEPYESLEPSGFMTGSSSWGPEPTAVRHPARPVVPAARFSQAVRGLHGMGSSTTPRAPGSGRSVEEVLSAPYETIQTRPPPPPTRRSPPVECDIRRPLPPPGRQPDVAARRPAPLLARDSGYSDLLAVGPERHSSGSDVEPQRSPARVAVEGCAPPLAGAELTVGAGGATSSWELCDDVNRTHEVVCPHCGTVFAGTEHLLYLNHVEQCPARTRRRREARLRPD